MMWSNGAPLTFQNWLQRNYTAEYTSISPIDPAKSNFFFATFLNDCVQKSCVRKPWTIYPHNVAKRRCTLMLLSHLAYSEWVTVDCDEKYVTVTICGPTNKYVPGRLYKPISEEGVQIASFCPSNKVFKNGHCYDFIKFLCNSNQIFHDGYCYKFMYVRGKNFYYNEIELRRYFLRLTHSNIKIFHFIFVAIREIFPSILSASDRIGIFKQFLIENISQNLKIKLQLVNHTIAEGFLTRRIIAQSNIAEKSLKSLSLLLLRCPDDVFVSSKFLCNKDNTCEVLNTTENITCNFRKNEFHLKRHDPFKTLQDEWNFTSAFEEILLHKITSASLNTETIKAFTCSNNNTIPLSLKDDLVPDCYETSEDEPILKDILSNHVFYPCPNPGQIPCQQGHTKCFNVWEICVYNLNEHGHLIPCRTGGHIEECRLFECNMKYKCPESYCIPARYICDGKWDCPDGHDELNDQLCVLSKNCSDMFHCSKSEICIYLVAVCDGYFDCPNKDDEVMCNLKSVQCPSKCTCINYAISCSGNDVVTTNHTFKLPFVSVRIMKANVNSINILNGFSYLMYIDLSMNKLIEVCGFLSGNISITSLDLGYNSIQLLQRHCYFNISRMTFLLLNHNNLEMIHPEAFVLLTNLQVLNISTNYLQNIDIQFTYLNNLDTLSIKNNPLTEITSAVFHFSKLQYLETEDYRVCCVAPQYIVCEAKRPWYISCADLLPSISITLVFTSISIIIIALNLFSIILQVKYESFKNVFSLLVFLINISDLICGFYLALLTIVHFYYKGIFATYEERWRRSTTCYIIFTLILFFNYLSPFLLLSLSLSRLMVIIDPLKSKYKDKSFVTKFIFLGSSIILMLCLTIALMHTEQYKEIGTSMCLPSVDFVGDNWFIKVLAVITACFQFFISLLICSVYGLLIKYMKQAKFVTKNVTSSQTSNYLLTLQLILVTVSNVMCWIPSNIIYLSSSFMTRLPVNLVIWTVIVVAPLNSILNPIIFILTAIKKSRKHLSK